MATIATYNFEDHISGDTFSGVQFEVLVNASALNLTGAAIKMQLKESASSKMIAEFSVANSKLEITDAVAGKFSFKKQIVEVCPKNYVYDIEIILANNDKHTYIKGTWKINP